MAKNYTLTHSNTDNWWIWECKDGSQKGTAPSKKEARRLARENCSSGYLISPPKVHADIVNGYIVGFEAYTLDRNLQYFPAGEINEDVFYYIFGYDENRDIIRDADIVIASLKIWGIYKGGLTLRSIMENHNLSSEQFISIADKSWIEINLNIDDDENYTWNFIDR